MRGKAVFLHRTARRAGITPAHAGKSMRVYVGVTEIWAIEEGSPPRMRGKGRLFHALGHYHGITPAHAGKSCIAVRISQEQKDHPRVCGEKLILYTDRCVKPGSPPRVRGKGTSTRWRETAGRITPACAGKSVHPLHNSVMHGDHPRVCGEKHGIAMFTT